MEERIRWGEEFSFYYTDEEYWISQNENGYYLTRVRGEVTQKFITSKDIFIKGKVGDKIFLEIWDDIKDQF